MNLKEFFGSRISLSSDSTPTAPSSPYPLSRRTTGTHSVIAIILAIVGLFILPEIFSSIAIVLGAYAWKREQGNLGLYIVIFGIATMIIGIYITAVVTLL